MKNKLIFALALVGVVGTLASCGGNNGNSKEVALGVGTISAEPELSYGSPLVELNFATAVYEGDKVVASLVDVYQIPLSNEGAAIDTTKDYATDTNVQTKRDRHDGYAMKETSAQIGAIEGGAEWYEQAAVLETYTEGLTSFDETDETLTAGCTMQTTKLFDAIKEAKTNTKGKVSLSSGEYTLALGHSISFEKDTETSALTQINISVIGLLLDSNSKIATAYLDEVQIPLTFNAEAAENENPYSITAKNAYGSATTQYNFNGQVIASKKEVGDKYDMKETSAQIGNIEGGAEWYEQAAAFEDYLVGKKVSELDATSSDLVAGCTMSTDTYFDAINNAVNTSLYNTKKISL